jgi:hypothetical protein
MEERKMPSSLKWFCMLGLLMTPVPALAQKCVDQGRPGAWLGHCNPTGSGSSRTVTVWIEQAPQIILGPPQIVWVRPNVDGSAQSIPVAVDNPVLKRELTNNSVTGWQLHRKSIIAWSEGDPNKARIYCEAALQRKNPSNEIAEIRDNCERIRQQTVGWKPPVFEKQARTTLQIPIDGLDNLFGSTDPRDEPLRQQFLPLLIKRAEARNRVALAAQELESAKAKNNKALIDKAQKQMARVAAERADIVRKIKEEKKKHNLVLDPPSFEEAEDAPAK